MAQIQYAPGPVIKGAYLTLVNDVPGTVAQNVFLALFNPTSSTVIMNGLQLLTGSYAVGSSATPNSFLASQISAISGGTQTAASAIPRFLSTMPDPTVQVFTGNPTITTSRNPVYALQTVQSTGAGNTGQTAVLAGSSALMLPGQGLAFYTTAGNVNQRFNVIFAWEEF